MPDNIINIISDPGNLAIFLAFVLCVVALLLYSGREYKVLGHVVIPGNDRVNLKKLPHSFQKEMIADLRAIYDQRVKDISNLNYEEALNWENDFLQRVRALYEGANSVFAVTLSSISDFWVSDSDKELIRVYLECQRDKEIHRLFVFKNPYDLKKYQEILRENFKAYGTKGGVYITSTEYYEEKILPNLCAPDSLYRSLDKDFGVWESDISILATLQGTSLSFKELKPKQLGDINVKGLKAIFKEQLPTGVFKWDPMSNSEELAHKIFTEDVTYVGPVTHLVFINHRRNCK